MHIEYISHLLDYMKWKPLSLISVGTVGRIMVPFYHMVWACVKVRSFWDTVTQLLGEIMGTTVHCDPASCLLNYTSGRNWSKRNRQILTTGYMTAKRMIAINWKDADKLMEGQWLSSFLETISINYSIIIISFTYHWVYQYPSVFLFIFVHFYLFLFVCLFVGLPKIFEWMYM